MAKNENGYPSAACVCKCVPCASQGGVVGGVTENNRPQEGCSNGGSQGGVVGGVGNQNGGAGGSMNHNGCGGSGDCLDQKLLAYVYAPDQRFRLLYSAKDAMTHGTLFEELYKPMEVYGRE